MMESLQQIVETAKTALEGPQRQTHTPDHNINSTLDNMLYLAKLFSGFELGPDPIPRSVTESILCLVSTRRIE